MPPKKGVATTKKEDKYVYFDEDSGPPAAVVRETKSAKTNVCLEAKTTSGRQSHRSCALLADSNRENIDFRGIPKRSNSIEPCQASESFHTEGLRQSTIASNTSPPEDREHNLPRLEAVGSDIFTELLRSLQRSDTPLEDTLRTPNPVLHHHDARAGTTARTPSHGPRLTASAFVLDA